MIVLTSLGLALGIFYFAQVSVGFWLLRNYPGLSALQKIVFGTLVSMVFFTGVIALLGNVFGPSVLWLLYPMAIWGVLQHKVLWAALPHLWQRILKQKISSLFVAFATLSLVSTVILSGVATNQGVSYQETHDNLWHVALAQQLQQHIPPLHPSFPEVTVQNYHYFYDLLLAAYATTTGVPVHLLYFQFFSLVYAGLLATSAYLYGSKIAGVVGGRLLVFFTFFVGSFAFAIPWFLPGQLWHESSFWVSQTFVMMLNPQIIFTLALVYAVLFFLQQEKSLQNARFFWFTHALIIGIIAISIGFKSYAWVVLSCIYGTYLLLTFLFTQGWQQKQRYLLLGVLLLFLSLPFVWLITGFRSGTFFYEPLWYINTMIEAPDRLSYLPWKFEEQFYVDRQNWLKVVQIKTQEIIIFFVGNLGVRFVFLGAVLMFFRKAIKQSTKNIYFAVFLSFLFASSFPLLFLQTGVVVWNSIQFWYYALILANVLAVVFLALVYKKVPVFVWYGIMLLLIALSVPTYVVTVPKKLSVKPALSTDQLAFLANTSSQDTIVICPENTDLYNTQLVSTHTAAKVYMSQTVQLSILGIDPSIQESFESIFKSQDAIRLQSLLEEKHIATIICTDPLYSQFISRAVGNSSAFTALEPALSGWLVFTR